MVISAISIMLSGAVLGISMKNFYENQELGLYITTLKKLVSYVDNITDNLRGVADVLANDVNVINLAMVPMLSRYKRNYGIIRQLGRIEETNSFIKSLYIYIPTGNLIVTPQDYIKPLEDFSEPAVYQFFADRPDFSNDFFLIQDKKNKQFNLFYCRDFVGSGNNKIGQLVLHINAQEVYRQMKNQWRGIGGEIRVVSHTGLVVVGDNDIGKEYLRQSDIQYLRTGDAWETKIHENYLFCNSPAGANWILVCKKEPGLFFMLSGDFLHIFIPTLLVYLVISVLLSWLISRNIYTPIGTLVSIILKEQGKKPEGKTHESEFIRKEYYSILENKNTTEKLLHDSLPFVSENLYERLLQGKPLAEQDMLLFSKLIDMQALSNSKFFVITIFLEKTSGEISADMSLESEVFCVEVKQSLSKIYQNKICDIFASYSHNRTILLCRVAADASSESLSLCELRFIEYFAANTRGQYGYRTTAGISTVRQGITAIRPAFREAEETLEHLLDMGIPGARTFEQIENIQGDLNPSPWRGGYTDEINKIINAISTGDSEKTRLHLQLLFEDLREKSLNERTSYDADVFLQLLDKLTQYAIRNNLQVNELTTLSIKALSRNLNNLLQAAHREEYVQSLCKKVAEYVAAENKKQWHKCVLAAQEYIRNNYTEIDLSLNTIADAVNINSAYLSKLFKDETNENVTEYIGKLRIQKAKKLLDNTYISVKEVGYSVGFNSIQTFIRTFKRYEGITPGKYNTTEYK
jgi:AraC-like DNA-binding protein